MNEVGVSTPLYYKSEKNLLMVLEHIARVGKVAEILVEPPYFPQWRTPQMAGYLTQIKDFLTTYDLKVKIHAPFRDLNLASPNPHASKAATEEITKAAEVAEKLGSDTLTFHPGQNRGDRQKSLQTLQTRLTQLDKKAKNHPLNLCIENMAEEKYLLNKTQEIKQTLESLENIHLTLDLGHAQAAKNLKQITQQMPGKIRHAHISDMKDSKHPHLPLGKGTLNLKDAVKNLKKTGYKGPIVIEAVGDKAVNSIARQAEYLRNLLGQSGG